jgi:molybdate transport system substrate-binding protein
MLRRAFIAALLLIVSVAFAADQPKQSTQPRQPLLVFAAASLTDTLQRISDEYTKTSGVPVKLSFTASSALAKQIETGAPADVFFSADQEWMDYLDSKTLLRPGTRTNLLGNRLALIAPRDSTVSIKLGPNAPILSALGESGRLATGDPDSVPAGKYARSALSSLGLWSAIEPRLARAENVRVALRYVARGEAPLGIVYATDAAVEPKVRLVDVFPEDSHPPITYPVALTKSAQSVAADYVQFLRSASATDIFAKAGFKPLAVRTAMASGCSRFAFDLSRELTLLRGTATTVAAGKSSDDAAVLEPGKAYRVALADQGTVRFAATPGRPTAAAGAHAGVLRLASLTSGTVRVTLNQPAWIDLVSGKKVLDASRHTGSHDCRFIRKSVEFAVERGVPLALQLSGSAADAVTLAITGS